jgi:hypothetical protein
MIDLRMLMNHFIFLISTSVSTFFYSLPASGTLPVIAFLWTDCGTQTKIWHSCCMISPKGC